jgi:hypothetical protein
MDAGTGHRVDAHQFIVQSLPAKASRLFLDAGPNDGVGGRQRREPLQQRLEIEHGAAHQQRNAAAVGNLFHLPQRILAKIGRRIAHGGVQDVDQPVRGCASSSAVGLAVPISMPR